MWMPYNKNLELTVLSARDLKKANPTEKMDVYVVVSLSGDPWYQYKETTPVHRDDAGPNHYSWGSTVAFPVDDRAKLARMKVTFRLKRKRSFLWDKEVGRVRVPVGDLLCKKGLTSDSTFRRRVQAPSGKYHGEFEFSFKISKYIVSHHHRHRHHHDFGSLV